MAIKQLPLAFAGDPVARRRFTREARLLASFDHQHIVRIYDYVERDGLCLVVMEKLSGGTLWERSAEGLTPQEACGFALAAASGLRPAHKRGVLHRDVKPQNLLFSDSGVLKLTDFGLAKTQGADATRIALTRQDEVVGTPAYMAPEQVLGGRIGPAADVYATGVLLFELLAGRLPFRPALDPLELAFRRVEEAPLSLSEAAPHVPAPVADVVMRALARLPEERIDSAERFAEELAQAASAAWGPGWLAATGVAVFGLVDSPPPSAPERMAATGREVAAFERGQLPELLGPFTLEEPLGIASWKTTYRARRHGDGLTAALTLVNEQTSADARFSEAFDRESRLARSVRHRSLAEVVEAGKLESHCFLAIRFIEGISLEGLLEREGPQPLRRCLRLASSLGSGLQRLHNAGLVHGDVHPSQVILGDEHQVTLRGFGLAAGTARSIGAASEATAFLAPEATARLAPTVDVFALGALLIASLLGGPAPAEALEHAAPADVAWVLARAVALDADKRPPTPVALARMLLVAAEKQ